MGGGRAWQVRWEAYCDLRRRRFRWSIWYVCLEPRHHLLTNDHPAIQLAKLSGFSPIIATASLHNTDLLRSLGATHVVDRRLSTVQLREEFGKITKEPLDVIYDAISSPETESTAYELLAPGGKLALVAPPGIPAEKAVPGKHFFAVFGSSMFPAENRAASIRLYQKLTAWLEEGLIKARYVA